MFTGELKINQNYYKEFIKSHSIQKNYLNLKYYLKKCSIYFLTIISYDDQEKFRNLIIKIFLVF